MPRLLGFTTLAGLVIGGASGSLFTPFGIPPGMAVGAVLGLLAGCCSAGLLRVEGPGLTRNAARLLLTAPPLILLALASAGAGISDAGWAALAAFGALAAVPLTVIVSFASTPWVLTLVRPEPADVLARPAMIRALLIPVWFIAAATGIWVLIGILWLLTT